MHLLLLVPMLLLSFLSCGVVSGDKNIKKLPTLPQQVEGKTNVADDKCDFSSFKPFTVSHFVKTSLKTQFKPIYPSEAVRQGLQGKISVKILVDRDGNVAKACALNGEDILKQTAEDAALKWKFKRKVIAGRESFVEAGISFNFVLDKNDSTDAEAIRP